MELKRLNVYLEAGQLETLRGLARTRRTSVSGLVIEAVRFLLRNPSLFMPASAGDLSSHERGEHESAS
jgi:hypothetical protein